MLLVVVWRWRSKLSLRDVAEMWLTRGFTFTHAAVRNWEARFALLLRQDGESVKGSLRSEPHKNVDVSKIAKSFGGGGHKLASGFKIEGKLSKEGDSWVVK